MFHHAALFVYNWQLVGSIEIVPAARASYSLFLRLDYSNRFAVDEGGKRILDSPRVRYPWGHGAHYQHDEARRHCDRHFRFDG